MSLIRARCISGISHGLGLDGGVGCDPLKILRGESPTLMRYGETYLQLGREMLLTQPLALTREGRAVKRQIIAEHRLAAEELHVGAVKKAGTQRRTSSPCA